VSAWRDYVTAGLVGSGKSAPLVLPAQLGGALGEAAAPGDDSRFLTEAGAVALWRRCGWKPARNELPIHPSEPETTAPLGSASAGHLRAMLMGRCIAVLPEWLTEVARLGRHVPHEHLPALLERARQDRALRPLVIAAGGRRAVWLAAQNPSWAFGAVESPELWETGTREQRGAILNSLRASAPAEARAKIEAVWQSEPAEVRAAFITALATNLSDDDAPFLESVLDDRSKEVRRTAADLLARLPSSPFVAGMVARATELVRFTRGGLLSRASLDVTLPAEPDAGSLRDGLDPKAFGPQKRLGERAVVLVLILSAVPLRHWTETFGQTPAAILKAAEKNEFAGALATGWAWAALRQRDAAWAEALIDGPIDPHQEILPAEPLFTLLPEATRVERLANIIRAGTLQKPGSSEWIDCLRELSALSERAPAALVRKALAVLRDSAGAGLPWQGRPSLEAWFLRMPRPLLAEAATGWPIDQEASASLVELLTFRHDALTALTQP
jgi:hypothetical protein